MKARRGMVSALALSAFALASAPHTPSRADDSETAKPKKPCHEVETQVQYRGLAYQHVVVIRNTCDKAITCTIKASSNPDVLEAKVASKATESVVVNGGSAASEFSADVQCK